MKNIIIIIAFLSFLSGCAAPYQFVEPQTDSTAIENVDANTAQIVFLRPSKGVMGAFQAIVFDITNGQRKLLGVAPARSKFAVKFPPGEYKFLSANGLPAHVMDLKVEAGKRYNVVVRPIYGNGLQLRPIKHSVEGEFGYDNPEIESWKSDTKVSVKAPGADEWHTKYGAQIDKTQVKALEVWAEKDEEQKALLTLLPEDAE